MDWGCCLKGLYPESFCEPLPSHRMSWRLWSWGVGHGRNPGPAVIRFLCLGWRMEDGWLSASLGSPVWSGSSVKVHLTFPCNAQNSPSQVQQYVNRELQMFRLDLEKAEEPEIKLPTSIGSSKKQESSRKTSISALLTMPKPLTVWITVNWKILQEMGIPDHLTCLLRNLYAGQEATVRTGHGTTDWFQIRKGVQQGFMLSPCLFHLYAEYIMRNARLDEAWSRIKIVRRNINNLWYADDTTLTVESEEELKSLMMKVREDSEKVDLKLNIQKTKIMASGPITSWQIAG